MPENDQVSGNLKKSRFYANSQKEESEDSGDFRGALQSALNTATRIDLIVAFITESGVVELEPLLKAAIGRGASIRVLTTTFGAITSLSALQKLKNLGAEVKVSYDTTSTRLHAKAWILYGEGHSIIAFIGSSNLTKTALNDGREWNVSLHSDETPNLIDDMKNTFNRYWGDSDFQEINEDKFTSTIEIARTLAPLSAGPRLQNFQENLLKDIEDRRQSEHKENLLVAATGTGKTVMAAFDYKKFRERCLKRGEPANLLFIAHRREILKQGMETFRYVLGEPEFGELLDGNNEPAQGFGDNHVTALFASKDSMSQRLKDPQNPYGKEFFQYIVVDEAHHVPAKTWGDLLDYFKPKELLGLTATPERMRSEDTKKVYGRFGGCAAAELRLWEAIECGYLVPFNYYGVDDGTSLVRVWKRGRYDDKELTNLYTNDPNRTEIIIGEVEKHWPGKKNMTVLGFCASIEHAKYMKEIFDKKGYRAECVDGSTGGSVREEIKSKLSKGDLDIVFSVEVYNEGVDIPKVNGILMLRPTKSPVIFQQQIGRGLRKHEQKQRCVVLDFVGNNHENYSTGANILKIAAGKRRDIVEIAENGGKGMLGGCYVELGKNTAKEVLESLRKIGEADIIHEMGGTRDTKRPKLESFIKASGIPLTKLYTEKYTYYSLFEKTQKNPKSATGVEEKLKLRIHKILHVNDKMRLDLWLKFLKDEKFTGGTLDQRVINMLLGTLFTEKIVKMCSVGGGNTGDYLSELYKYPQVVDELVEVLEYLLKQCDSDRDGGGIAVIGNSSRVPLSLFASYARQEIVNALDVRGDGRPEAGLAGWMQGQFFVKKENAALVDITLDKTQAFQNQKYEDKILDRSTVKWQTQNDTSRDSKGFAHYDTRPANPATVYIFVRCRKEEPYSYLGTGKLINAEGDRPVNVTWALETPIPESLYKKLTESAI